MPDPQQRAAFAGHRVSARRWFPSVPVGAQRLPTAANPFCAARPSTLEL